MSSTGKVAAIATSTSICTARRYSAHRTMYCTFLVFKLYCTSLFTERVQWTDSVSKSQFPWQVVCHCMVFFCRPVSLIPSIPSRLPGHMVAENNITHTSLHELDYCVIALPHVKYLKYVTIIEYSMERDIT